MASKSLIKKGYIIGLIGFAISFVRILFAFSGFMKWITAEEAFFTLGGYMLFLAMCAAVIAIISILIGIIGDRNASIGLILGGIILLGIFIYSFYIGYESPDENVYSFIYFNIGTFHFGILPIEPVLYILSGIIVIIGYKKR